MRRTFALGDEIGIDDEPFLVVGLSGSGVKLRNLTTGGYVHMAISELFRAGAIEKLGPVPLPVDNSVGELATMSTEARVQAQFWREHIEEILYGVPYGAAESDLPRPEYEPAKKTLSSRVDAKSIELTRAGSRVSSRTLHRKIAAYRLSGVAALVDKRHGRMQGPLDKGDQRVLEGIKTVIADQDSESTKTRSHLISDLKKELMRCYPGEEVPLPSQSTLYRYFEQLSRHRYTFDDATARRSKARTPKRAFGVTTSTRPGEFAQIDSTPLDVMAIDEHGAPCRVILTMMVDVATATIIGSAMRPDSAKGADHTMLLARCLLPEPFRPHQAAAWRLANAQLVRGGLSSSPDRRTDVLSMPYIVPDTITIDNGRDFDSAVFASACARLEIGINKSSPLTPTDKAKVERTFGSINTLFTQYLPGYKGRSVSTRGSNAGKGEILDIITLQAVFEEWVVTIWQNRPHDALRDPLYPSNKLTPNQMYAAALDVAPEIPVPFSEADFISLMPAAHRLIRAEGVQIDNRVYDSPALNPHRGTSSPDAAHGGKWEVRFYPYNLSMIWVRDYKTNAWMPCTWRRAGEFDRPMYNEIWTQAREIAKEQGRGENVGHIQALQDILERTNTHRRKTKKISGRRATTEKQDALDVLPRPKMAAVERPAIPSLRNARRAIEQGGTGRKIGLLNPEDGL